jgi:hypothetical protein
VFIDDSGMKALGGRAIIGGARRGCQKRPRLTLAAGVG